jgi:sortase A
MAWRILIGIFRLIKGILGVACIGIGIWCFFYMDIQDFLMEQNTTAYIQAFETQYGIVPTQNEEKNKDDDSSKEKATQSTKNKKEDAIYQAIQTYNRSIYQNEQVNFNAESLKESPLALDLMDEKFGYIEIPSMEKTFPLYLGASDENMSKGLAIMGQTSIPIGGKNTNSVISGHRGWDTGNFLRDIEKVKIGECIYITNPWETLTYEVVQIDVVSPYDSNALLIQEGKDMVTIMTCHPYLSHGKYRYLVYCERCKNSNPSSNVSSESVEEQSEDSIVASDGSVYPSSNGDIAKEDTIRKILGGCIIGLVLISFVKGRRRKSKMKSEIPKRKE